jgi:hypothetical protein
MRGVPMDTLESLSAYIRLGCGHWSVTNSLAYNSAVLLLLVHNLFIRLAPINLAVW